MRTIWIGCAIITAPIGCKPSDPPPVESVTSPLVGDEEPPSDQSQPADTPPDTLFTEITKSAGISFVHDAGATGQLYIPEGLGSGAAFLDFDRDGDLDIYFVQSGRIPGTQSGHVLPNKLYRNDGRGAFTDVTTESATGDTGYGLGVACADYDNDGDVDIYVTNYGPNVLFRNEGNGRFTDVSLSAGVANDGFGTSAVWFDYDHDGHLDLYIANYVVWRPADEGVCYSDGGIRDYCAPLTFPAQADVLYRNRGDGTFEDVSAAAGIAGPTYNGLGVVADDFNGDGRTDLYVANDQHPNLLWINQGDGTFRDQALLSGCAVNAVGMPEASMGIAAEDLDADGDVDLFMTHIRGETHTYFRNDGGFFEDVTAAMGLASWNVMNTGFGVGFFDFDNDGLADLFIANGAVNLASEPQRADNPYAERDHLFHRRDNGSFEDYRARAGDLCKPIEMGRGAVFGDFDNDGDVDLLVTNNRAAARLFRNDNPQPNHWALVQVLQRPDGRHSLGARIEIRCGDRKSARTVRRQYSYMSSCDPRVHFGLGNAERIDLLTVRWPTGESVQWTDLPADRIITAVRGRDQPTIETP